MRVDLIRHLRFFVTVAQEKHFGHAADELGLTQPPVSQGIQRLEARWNVRLFERNSRGVRPTAAALALLPAAQHVLEAAQDVDREAFLLADAVRPRRVSFPPELAGLSTGCIAQVAEAAPAHAPLLPYLLATTIATEKVRRGELDLAVIQHPAVIDGLEAGPVHTVHRTLAVGPGSPPAGHVREVHLPVAMPARGDNPPAHDQLLDELRRCGHRGHVRETASVAEAIALTAASVTCMVHPLHDLPPLLRAVPGGQLDLRCRVIRPRLAPPDDVQNTLKDTLETYLARL